MPMPHRAIRSPGAASPVSRRWVRPAIWSAAPMWPTRRPHSQVVFSSVIPNVSRNGTSSRVRPTLVRTQRSMSAASRPASARATVTLSRCRSVSDWTISSRSSPFSAR
ncbi:hypothetical protein DDJ31_04420 [Streptomyces griseoviridis]|uniref:Uncharacterized protein n=1 Tax=Streptomyces griseoviridis TaxID=45398 RepID=A0ABX5TP64_STRGD|nr:hypothetical protein DDJ31_04420 [Streptomyces griseoviridis]